MKTEMQITFSSGELNEMIVAVEDQIERYKEGLDMGNHEDYLSYIEYLKIALEKLKVMHRRTLEKLER